MNQRNGTATVDVTPSTTVAELTPAQVTDVTAGSCVAVRPTHDDGSGGAQVTARNVVIGTAPDGTCTAPQHARAGAVRGSALRILVERLQPEVRLTPLQDVLLCNLSADARTEIERIRARSYRSEWLWHGTKVQEQSRN